MATTAYIALGSNVGDRAGTLSAATQRLRAEPGLRVVGSSEQYETLPVNCPPGSGTFLNMGVMVAGLDLIEIGDHCMFANGCFITDSAHRFDDPERPVTWQGFTSKGPTRIGDNVWCGANVVVTSGVTVGDRCVIGANSVVTSDIPAYSVAAGAPARVLRTITY